MMLNPYVRGYASPSDGPKAWGERSLLTLLVGGGGSRGSTFVKGNLAVTFQSPNVPCHRHNSGDSLAQVLKETNPRALTEAVLGP